MQVLALTPNAMDQTPEHRLPYFFPPSKLSVNVDSGSNEPRVDCFLEDIRSALLACLQAGSSREYERYCSHFDRYLIDVNQGSKYAFKPSLYVKDTDIWRREKHNAKGIKCVQDTAHRWLSESGSNHSIILTTLLRLLPQSFGERYWYQTYPYKEMVIKGLLKPFVYLREIVDENLQMKEKILFALYAMERVLPSDGDYGGPGLTAYVECASMLVNLGEIGLHRHARLLEICKSNDPAFNANALQKLEKANASSYRKLIKLKKKLTFFICADAFLEAATWIQQNLTFEIAKRFGAFNEQPYSATFMRSAISAYNEGSGWKLARIRLTDEERKNPVLHAVPLQLRAWRTIWDRETTIDEKMLLASRSNDSKTCGDRMRDTRMEEVFSLTDTKKVEEVFGVELSELLSLLDGKFVDPQSGRDESACLNLFSPATVEH